LERIDALNKFIYLFVPKRVKLAAGRVIFSEKRAFSERVAYCTFLSFCSYVKITFTGALRERKIAFRELVLGFSGGKIRVSGEFFAFLINYAYFGYR
jgi:hypothetical protein